jgi:hypothetical protein
MQSTDALHLTDVESYVLQMNLSVAADPICRPGANTPTYEDTCGLLICLRIDRSATNSTRRTNSFIPHPHKARINFDTDGSFKFFVPKITH